MFAEAELKRLENITPVEYNFTMILFSNKIS